MSDFALANVSMSTLPRGVQQTLHENGLTPEAFQAEAREIFRRVIDQSERQEAINSV